MATILDGKKLAETIQNHLASEVQAFVKKYKFAPGLAVVLVGDNPASQVYVRNKRITCQKVGIQNFDYDLPATISEQELLKLLHQLNHDPKVHGILVQLPLPKHINEEKVLLAIDPAKDADGFHPLNAGKVALGKSGFRPCTPLGVMAMLDDIGCNPRGKHAVVIGRSNIVGKPMAFMLLEREATVTICHSATVNLEQHVRDADILVVAVGKPKLIPGDWIKPGGIVIDVGINRTAEGKLIGDVDFEGAKKNASAITPVPGGVGPMTIAMLLANVLQGAKDAQKNSVVS